MAALAAIEAEATLERMPPPANDGGRFKPWMGMAAAVAVATVVGVASLWPGPADRGAPVMAADAGPQPVAPLRLGIGPRGLVAADRAAVAEWARQPGLCGQRVTLITPAGAAGMAAGQAATTIITETAGCAVNLVPATGSDERLELIPG